jgi:hypothetical protein
MKTLAIVGNTSRRIQVNIKKTQILDDCLMSRNVLQEMVCPCYLL